MMMTAKEEPSDESDLMLCMYRYYSYNEHTLSHGENHEQRNTHDPEIASPIYESVFFILGSFHS